ncbi:MAG: cell division protein FtsA [Anaerolineae bacterium]
MGVPIAALDIGTTKTCALIGEVAENGKLRILGVGIAPSNGLRKGIVVDVKLAAQSIAAAVEQAERAANMSIEGAYVGIAGAHISSTNSRGVAGIPHTTRGVTQDVLARAMEAAAAIAVPENREIIHAIPRGYTLDGQDGVRDPIGMMGFRLEVEAHIVTGATPSIQNLYKAVEAAGVKVISLALEPIASGEAVLTPSEREMGVALVDIGGGTTDIAIFIDGSVWHTVVLPLGGLHLTNDLAVGLRAPFNVAEEIKIKYGTALVDDTREQELIELAAFGEEDRRATSRRDVAEILCARADEILQMVLTEIKRSGYDGLLPAGVVLCGGAAQLAGMKSFARGILNLPVRIGSPENIEGLTDRISTPSFATSVGLVRWGLRQNEERVMEVARVAARAETTARGNLLSPVLNLGTWLKRALLPE